MVGGLLSINPFDQPNVTESKENTSRILDEVVCRTSGPPPSRVRSRSAAAVSSTGSTSPASTASGWPSTRCWRRSSRGATRSPPVAYLDRERDADAHALRAALARRTEQAVTFGWAPSFLHSTGRSPRGQPPSPARSYRSPAPWATEPAGPRPAFTFGTLQAAQAAGDPEGPRRELTLLHLHLTDRSADLEQLRAALA